MAKRNQQNQFDQFIGLLGKAVWLVVTLPFKKRKNALSDTGARWSEVQQLMKSSEPTAWVTAILKADTILNDVLKARVSGETLGERLKNSQKIFRYEAYQAAWNGHKLRNHVAHEHTDITRSQAEHAIMNFRSALNDLGVL